MIAMYILREMYIAVMYCRLVNKASLDVVNLIFSKISYLPRFRRYEVVLQNVVLLVQHSFTQGW